MADDGDVDLVRLDAQVAATAELLELVIGALDGAARARLEATFSALRDGGEPPGELSDVSAGMLIESLRVALER